MSAVNDRQPRTLLAGYRDGLAMKIDVFVIGPGRYLHRVTAGGGINAGLDRWLVRWYMNDGAGKSGQRKPAEHAYQG